MCSDRNKTLAEPNAVASLVLLFFPYLYTCNFLSNCIFFFVLTGSVMAGGFPFNILSCISAATLCNASITSSLVFVLLNVIILPPTQIKSVALPQNLEWK